MARHSGLGRGLGALIPTSKEEGAEAKPAGGDLPLDLHDRVFREIPIDSIRPNTYQPRSNIDEDQLESLVASIKELGVLQPLLVRESPDGKFELIAGERRWRASKLASLTTLPVIVRTADDAGALEQALVENLHRKDLNPLDEAAAYQQLIDDFKMTHDQIGKRVGRSRAAISNLLRLLQLPIRIQRLLMEERLSEGHARALLGIEDSAFQIQIAERTIREQLSVRAIEDAARMRREFENPQTKPMASRPKAASTKADAVALEWQERIAQSLDTRVTIAATGKRGRIVVEFADLDDLDRLSSLIVGASSNTRPDD